MAENPWGVSPLWKLYYGLGTSLRSPAQDDKELMNYAAQNLPDLWNDLDRPSQRLSWADSRESIPYGTSLPVSPMHSKGTDFSWLFEHLDDPKVAQFLKKFLFQR